MRSSVEFHDSTVSAIIVDGTSVRIAIDGYVHHWELVDGTWKGTGWMQPVQIVLVNSSPEKQAECPVGLTDGRIQTRQVTHDNLIPLPFESSGPASLRLELVTGAVLNFDADNLVIEPTGERRYVEDLPDDLRLVGTEPAG